LFDEVFGSANFISQIAFQKSGSTSSATLPNTLDYILVGDAADAERMKYRPLVETYDIRNLDARNYRWAELPDGSTRQLTPDERADPGLIPPDQRLFRFVTATSRSASTTRSQTLEIDGVKVSPGKDRHWSVDPATGFGRLRAAGRLSVRGSTVEIKRFLDDFRGSPLSVEASRKGDAMPRNRRSYDLSFKEGAVAVVRQTGKPVRQVARELGIPAATLI
jgi:adenine-specific DNA-methyltransferase